MISYSRFGKLRLAQFLPDAKITEVANWEFMDAIWVGESLGFSEWLRLEAEPTILRSLAIDFKEFPEKAANAVLRAIDLPIRAGMRLEELRAVLGEPIAEHRFVADRVFYDFAMGPPRYKVSCNVLNESGLSYLVVVRAFPKGEPE